MTTNYRRSINRFLLWAPVVVYMAGIFYLSAQSSPPAPSRIPDKLQHAVEYFGFGLVVFRAVAGGLGSRVTAAHVKATLLIVVSYAISDELHQLFVPLRTADVRDVARGRGGRVDRADRVLGVAYNRSSTGPDPEAQVLTLTTPRHLPPMDIRGSVVATGCRFAIIVSRFNEEITSGLLIGARAALLEAGVRDDGCGAGPRARRV